MSPRPVPRGAVAVVCTVLALVSLFLVGKCVALNGDAAYHVLKITDTGTFTGPSSRFFSIVVRQAFAVLAVKLGATDTHLIAILLGVGQILVPSAILALAVVLARHRLSAFAIVTITTGVVTGATAMFSVGEGILTVAIAVLLATLLWLPRPWRLSDAVVAVVASVLLARTHESAVVTAPLLAAWSLMRARHATASLERWACRIVGVTAVVTTVVTARILATQPDDPRAHDLSGAVFDLIPLELYTAMLGGAGIVLLLVARLGARLRLAVTAVTILACGGTTVGFLATNGDGYRARGGTAIAALLTGSALMALWRLERRGRPSPRQRPPAAAWIAVGFAIVPLVALVPRAERWGRSFDAFRTEVSARTGVVQAIDVLSPDRRQVLFDWTASSLSVVVRPRIGSAVLVDPRPSFEPFPPRGAHAQMPPRFRWHSW